MIKKILKKAAAKCYMQRYLRRIKRGLVLSGKYSSLYLIADSYLDEFKRIKRYNDSQNVAALKTKSRIRIGLVVYTSSMWNVDELYQFLMKDEKFDVQIILAHLQMPDQDASEFEYQKAKEYFSKLHYPITEANDIEDGVNFDILLYLTPFPLIEKNVELGNVPLETIVMYTSYSYMLSGNSQKLDIWMFHLSLKYYTDSAFYKKLVATSRLYTGNAEYLGFPKMDQYYSAGTFRPSEKKIIIYAPHHSVQYKDFKSSTFEDNYLAILELAKKYSDKLFWIYKPHPLLRVNSVVGGVFQSVEEYDAYEKQWSSLENAIIVDSGNYYAVFKGSDAMITDSVSFLAEYQFTGKPLLLLESGKETYNEFGNQIKNILYKCDGKAIDEIEAFLTRVIHEEDPMRDERSAFFQQNLFYLEQGHTANRRIYEDIVKLTQEISLGEMN